MEQTLLSRFASGYRDPVCAGYPLGQGYRWHFPGPMRFNRRDSFSPFGSAGLNAYAYCDADPINKADPSGHMPCFQWLFDAFRRRAPREEDRAETVVARLSRGDAPLSARGAIQRTTSMPADLPRLATLTDLPAGTPSGAYDREESLQGQRVAGLSQLPDMNHLPRWAETLASVKLTGLVRHVSLMETEWREMKDLYTRTELDIWPEAQRFARLYAMHEEVSERLRDWKNTHIPPVFDLPSTRASGDTHYRLIGKYLAASRRLRRLNTDWASAANFFLVPPEHRED